MESFSEIISHNPITITFSKLYFSLLAHHVETLSLDLEEFQTKLQKQSRNYLSFASHNARSLPSSHSLYVSLLHLSQLTAFSVTETWLKSTTPSKQVELAGYKLFRNDRKCGKKKRGGGVGIYVRSKVRTKTVLMSNEKNDIEFLFLELMFNGGGVIFGVIYRPPWSSITSFIETFDSILDELASKYSRVIITGDFNIDVNIDSSATSSFLTAIERHSLKIIPSSSTCHSNNSRSSKVDLVLVSNSEAVNHLYQSSVAGISDHDMLAIDFRVRNDNREVRQFLCRNVDGINVSSLLHEAQSLRWHEIYTQYSVDGKMDILHRFLKCLLDTHAPVRTFKINEADVPWINSEIRHSLKLRDAKHCEWKRKRSDSVWNDYCRLRNQSNRLLAAAKASYNMSQLNPELGPKKLWQNVRKLGLMDSKHCVGSTNFNSTDLNNHFTNINPILPNALNRNYDDWHCHSSFSFNQISIEDIVKSVNRISSNAVGNDGIPIKFIKMLLPVLSPILSHVFNHMIMSSTFPSSWKIGHIVPVAKVSAPTTVNDFRPISLLPSLSKVLEHILHNQITTYLDSYSLLNPLQSGFRKHCGTTTALVKIVDDLKLSMTAKQFSVLVLLDFSKAFDTIDHALLLSKLEKRFGFENCAVQLVESYLSDRSQYVEFDNLKSETVSLRCGVPQGSILGPLLFSLFINDLPSVLTDVHYHMYADDFQIYASSTVQNQTALINLINGNISSVVAWSKENGLQLNAKKTQTLKVCKKSVLGQLSDLPKITVDTAVIDYSDVVKNLGLYMDQHLDFHSHVNNVCRTVYGGLHSLNRLRSSTPLHVREKMFNALLRPHFMYCDIIYSATTSVILSRLQQAFNSCLRYVLDLKKYDHISQHSSRLLGCSLEIYFKLRAATFLFKIIHFPVPSYLLPYRSAAISNRTSNLMIPHYPLGSNYNSSYRVRACNIWNGIQPHNIKRLTSISAFKSQCLRSFLD